MVCTCVVNLWSEWCHVELIVWSVCVMLNLLYDVILNLWCNVELMVLCDVNLVCGVKLVHGAI
jgi:hypothetical protein